MGVYSLLDNVSLVEKRPSPDSHRCILGPRPGMAQKTTVCKYYTDLPAPSNRCQTRHRQFRTRHCKRAYGMLYPTCWYAQTLIDMQNRLNILHGGTIASMGTFTSQICRLCIDTYSQLISAVHLPWPREDYTRQAYRRISTVSYLAVLY